MWVTTAYLAPGGSWFKMRKKRGRKSGKECFSSIAAGWGKFPIFLKQKGLKQTRLKQTAEFIGTCGIEPFNLEGRPEVELGYRLCLKFWGHGYATEAATAILNYGFSDLKLAKIMAFVLPQNKASVRILERLGFQYLRDFVHAGLSHRLYEFPKH